MSRLDDPSLQDKVEQRFKKAKKKLELVPTRYDIIIDKWTYTAHRIKTHAADRGWSLTKRETDKVQIPAYMYSLGTKGFECMLVSSSDLRFFKDIGEVEDFLSTQ